MESLVEATPAGRRSNPVGIASLVAGLLMVLASMAAQTVVPLLPAIMADLNLSYRTIPYLMSLPPAILATIATALGVVGLLLRERARVPAIIGTTLGASHLIIGVAGLLGAMFLFPIAR